MAKRKPKARRKFNPQARMGVHLKEMLAERTSSPHGEYGEHMKRPADARFEAFVAKDNSVAEIDVYDVIGSYETNAATFRSMLNQITAKRIVVNINSPGGSVFDAFAMHADLRAHAAQVHVKVHGLAASAASVLAMAGDTIEIAENGFFMVHNAWVLDIGDRRQLEKTAKVLGQIDNRIAKTYAARTGADLDDIVAMMDEETWMDAEDAIEAGFADAISEAAPAQNLAHDVSRYGNAPAALRKAVAEAHQAAPAPAGEPVTVTPEAPVDDVAAQIRALASIFSRG